MSASEAKQRLVAIDVGEVSIVDHPANEEPFVVTKAVKPEGAPVAENAPVVKAAGVMLDPYTASQVTLDSIRSLMYRVTDKIGDPTKTADVQAELARITTMMNNAAEFAAMVNKAMEPVVTEVTKAKEEDAKDKPKGKLPPFMKEALSKVREALKAMDDEPDDAEATTKAMDVILKAGKAQFSKERMTKLAEAFKHMGELYKAGDSEGFKKAMDDWTAKPATAQSGGEATGTGGGTTGVNTDDPKAATPANGSANKAGEPSVGASAPAWFDSAISNLTKQIKDVADGGVAVAKRVEAIEATEAVSKALPHGIKDGQPVVKKDTIWKGLL